MPPQLRERVTALETDVPHIREHVRNAHGLATKAAKDIVTLQESFRGLESELRSLREMLKRYFQIGSWLAVAMVLNMTSGKAGEISSLLMKALVSALRHSF